MTSVLSAPSHPTGTADLAPAYPPPAANSDAYRTQDPERPGFTRRRTPH